MTKLACVAVLVGSLAGCAYPNTAMVEVANAPPPPHRVAPPPPDDAQPDDYDAVAFLGDLVGAIFDGVADGLAAHAAHHR